MTDKALYLALVRSIIKEEADPKALIAWWNDHDNKQQRFVMLDDEEHARLKAECIAKVETLKAEQQAKLVAV